MTEGEIAHTYLQDELGSPVRLLEMGKNRQTVYGYDAFGQDLFGNQGEVQPFGYTGYQKDRIAGTYFAQAREYLPEVGRFGGEDLVKGKLNFPLTLNQYGYCWGNSLTLVDYNGKNPLLVIDWINGKIEAAQSLVSEARAAYDNQRVSVPEPVFPERSADMPDYTVIINTWLYSKEQEFGKTKLWWGSMGCLKPFYNQVKTGGPMDIKDIRNWSNAFGNDIPQVPYFIYNGEVMDAGTLGNITYGYIGAYIGYADEILYYGGGYANMKVLGEKYIPATPFMPNYGDSPEDIIAIKKGIDLFYSEHLLFGQLCNHTL